MVWITGNVGSAQRGYRGPWMEDETKEEAEGEKADQARSAAWSGKRREWLDALLPFQICPTRVNYVIAVILDRLPHRRRLFPSRSSPTHPTATATSPAARRPPPAVTPVPGRRRRPTPPLLPALARPPGTAETSSCIARRDGRHASSRISGSVEDSGRLSASWLGGGRLGVASSN